MSPCRQVRITAALLVGGAVSVLSSGAEAQKALRPNVLLVFDTSGSMQLDQNGAWAGENTNICPSTGVSRLYALKKALRDTLAQVGADEANFGLMSFPSVEDATLAVTTGSSGCFPCTSEGCAAATRTNGWVGHTYVTQNSRYGCTLENQPTRAADTSGTDDPYGSWFDIGLPQAMRVGVTGGAIQPADGSAFDPADGNIHRIHEWIDNIEQPAGAAAITNHELHANGATPLGRSLFYARYYFKNYIQLKDPKNACRQNIVILVTDGNDSCDNVTSDQEVNFNTCSFPQYATYHPARQACRLFRDAGVKTYVLTDSSVSGSLNNNIALAGGTGSALRVSLTDSTAVKAAILGIIAKTVPPAEVCNGVDDNCNGIVDEDVSNRYPEVKCGNPMVGSTGWNSCMTEDTQRLHCAVETCNCADDDFDGTKDEGLPQNACGQPCGCAVPPEVCDGADNDCDGQVDELFNVGTLCSNRLLGSCYREGIYVCNGPSGTICNAPTNITGTEEICNNVDDDCNGLTDDGSVIGEGQKCGAAKGQCSTGVLKCSAGKLICTSTSVPQQEVCNGLDDDCNGITDDGNSTVWPWLHQECYCEWDRVTMTRGQCRPGQLVCKNTQTCEGCIGPTPEVCDGLDNDCNGLTDDGGNPCGNARFRCNEGRCLLLCQAGEFQCPSGYKCEGDFCIPQRCNGVVCYSDEKCDNDTGKCVSLCHGINCTAPSYCFNGVCVTCYNSGFECPSGRRCIGGSCLEDRCQSLSCGSDEYCVDSGEAAGPRCVKYCETVKCAAGQRCVQGQCEADPCWNKACDQHYFCDPATGDCRQDTCDFKVCPAGQVCVSTTSKCIQNPCDGITCSACWNCAVTKDGQGTCVINDQCDAYHVSTAPRGATRPGCSVAGASTGDGLLWLLVALPLFLRRRRR